MRPHRKDREESELTQASLRLAIQFTALVVVLLGLAGALVYGLVSTQTRQAAERTLASAVQSNSPRDAPLDVFLAVYDDGRLAVSRNMPSGLPDEEALAEVAQTGLARRDTVTAGDRTYEVLTTRRGPDMVQAALDTRESTEQLHRLILALVVSVAVAGLAAGAVSALAARAAMRPLAEALALQRRSSPGLRGRIPAPAPKAAGPGRRFRKKRKDPVGREERKVWKGRGGRIRKRCGPPTTSSPTPRY